MSPGKRNVRVGCPKDKLEFKFFSSPDNHSYKKRSFLSFHRIFLRGERWSVFWHAHVASINEQGGSREFTTLDSQYGGSRIPVPPWPLAGFVSRFSCVYLLGHACINRKLFISCTLEFLAMLPLNFFFGYYLSIVHFHCKQCIYFISYPSVNVKKPLYEHVG